ncbi:hypothetical protein ACIQWR_05990 [Streptomyces sp. NPDC098789]|uniref:hypothetical protein n=1 Tax=Streptomyces sp. NPDC098789 TaxID=3366098 RepID=UPI0038245638
MNENDQQPTRPPVPAPPAPYAPPTSPTPYATTPPVPPSKAKRAVWIVAAVLVTAASVLGGRAAMNALLDPDEPKAASTPGARPSRSAPAPEAAEPAADAGRYRLAPPASFQGLTLQDSGPRVDAIKQGQGPAKPGTKPVAVVYADGEGTAQLVVSGTEGRFADEDPGAAVDTGLRAMGIQDGQVTTHEAGAPAGGAMRCGILAIQGGSLPLCMWADHSTLVTVTVPIENKPVTLDALAARAKALREVMEVPAS